jgi:hypothetical protein
MILESVLRERGLRRRSLLLGESPWSHSTKECAMAEEGLKSERRAARSTPKMGRLSSVQRSGCSSSLAPSRLPLEEALDA